MNLWSHLSAPYPYTAYLQWIKYATGAKKYHYINAPTGLSAIFVQDDASFDKLYYVMSDHLGSLNGIVRADSVSLVDFYSFNSWGVPRNPGNWTLDFTGDLFAGRGFTGHEHLMEFSLINMPARHSLSEGGNGWVYNPEIGRFLSPDPYVQAPGYAGNFNRYAYCLNNPLVYTDPSGYDPLTLLGIGIFAIWSYFKNAQKYKDEESGKWAWNPISWFKHEDFAFYTGANINSNGSEMTFFAGGGFDETTFAVSYNTNKGPGYGSRNSEGLNQSYPSYNYNISEQNAAAINNIEPQNSNSQFFEGDLQNVIDIMIYKQDKFGIEFLVYNTNYGYYFEQSEGIVKFGYPRRKDLKNRKFLTFDEKLMGYYKTSSSDIHCTPYHLNSSGELTLYTLGSSKNYGKPNYILHTHPRTSYLSEQDLIQMSRYGDPTWVITPNGGIWGEKIYLGGAIDEVWISPN